jgi:hypothetical protein
MSKPSQVARMTDRCIEMQIPFYMAGPIGAGKSQITRQVCDARKIGFTDVRMSQMDPTDIKGFPSPDAVNNVMRWLPADFLPPMLIKGKPNKTKGLLFLDELPSAPVAVQAAAYQLILDRQVGNYTLPEGWCVGGAGNRQSDRSIVNKMPAALANRLVHIDYEVDVDDWVAHAMASGIHANTIAFIRFRSNLLHNFDSALNPMAFPTPRSWFMVDKILRDGMPQADEHALITGTVGQGAATEFAAFMKVIRDLPTIDEIKLSPDSARIPKSPATLYALTTTLGMATTASSFSRFMQYVERMEKEWQVVYIRDCLRRENKVKFDAVFTKWTLANADIVL